MRDSEKYSDREGSREMDSVVSDEPEGVIDPSLPIIDPHHHIWNAAHGKYDYLVPELLADIHSGHRIVQTVYCECKSMFRQDGAVELRPVGETEFVIDSIARGGPKASNLCTGLVMFADLMLGAKVQPVLDAHYAAAGARIKGIRNIAAHDPSPLIRSFVPGAGLLSNATFREGIACLVRNALVFETFVFHPQLGELADLAAAFPEATIVVGGLGGPLGVGPYKGRRQEVFEAWRCGLNGLARHENVYVHIGAFGAKMLGLGLHKREVPPRTQEYAAAWAPYVDVCLEAFGPQRCMLTSNYPEDRSSISYRQLWNVFKTICRDLSSDEKRQIFSETAARVYKLAI